MKKHDSWSYVGHIFPVLLKDSMSLLLVSRCSASCSIENRQTIFWKTRQLTLCATRPYVRHIFHILSKDSISLLWVSRWRACCTIENRHMIFWKNTTDRVQITFLNPNRYLINDVRICWTLFRILSAISNYIPYF